MRYINELAGSAVQAFVAARPRGTLRVLEIGAGTGGTTAAVLPCLPADRTRYRFTDVAPFFFDRARDEFGSYRAVDFGVFDLDRTVVEQGFDRAGFDLVIAANAVHAAAICAPRCVRLRELLAAGGVLMLVESTEHIWRGST